MNEVLTKRKCAAGNRADGGVVERLRSLQDHLRGLEGIYGTAADGESTCVVLMKWGDERGLEWRDRRG